MRTVLFSIIYRKNDRNEGIEMKITNTRGGSKAHKSQSLRGEVDNLYPGTVKELAYELADLVDLTEMTCYQVRDVTI